MNLHMITPKNEIEDFLLSITKNCRTLVDQTYKRPEEALEFKKTKSKETFHFNPPIQVKEVWMLGLVDLEVYNSIFNIREENSKFKIYKFRDEKIGGITYEKARNEIEKDLDIEGITAEDLQDEIIGPLIIREYEKQVSKRMNDEQYLNILTIYSSSVFQDFESFLRSQIDLIEDDIKLVLDEYNSNFNTYELEPGIYTSKDISEALLKIIHPEYAGYHKAIEIEYDDITMKTKLKVRAMIVAIRFDEKSFFSTILGFTPGWDNKHYNQYLSQKIVNLSSTNKKHLKCDCIDG